MSHCRLAACLALLLVPAAAGAVPVVPPLFPGVHSVLWIGAHPDDEIYVSPLLGRLCLEEHLKCSLLVLTRGEHGHCLLPGGCKPDLATVRSAEMAQAARLLGAQLTFWSLPDGGGAADASAPGWDVAAGGHEALVARLAAQVSAIRADLVITFDPRHGTTCHPDHRAAGALTVEALPRIGKRPVLYFLETRREEHDPPFVLLFLAAASAHAGVFAFDANTILSATGQPAWQMLIRDVQTHRSQFDSRIQQAVRAVVPAGRAVFLGPADLLLPATTVWSCPP
jgi:LmbE family N-acetylglucosaminyl deacetylase